MRNESIRSRDELLRGIRAGLRPTYLFFWGHKPRPDGEIGESCFSQWWPDPFTVEDVKYPTAEHFMMAAKAQLFGDEDARVKILEAGSPNLAKQFGRQVKNFREEHWAESRFQLVVSGNLAKFTQNPALAEFLLATNDKLLVEASPLDKIWGIGLGGGNENARNPEKWRGLNLLGFALMEVRQRLLDGTS